MCWRIRRASRRTATPLFWAARSRSHSKICIGVYLGSTWTIIWSRWHKRMSTAFFTQRSHPHCVLSAFIEKFLKIFFIKSVTFQTFSYFCNAICPLWFWDPNRREEPLGGALHIKRRYWRFVFGHSETTTFRITVENIAGVTPRGVYIRLRSVLRGLTMSSLAHFTVYLYTSVWVFLCLFTVMGCGRPQMTNRQMQSSTFFLCRYQ